MTAALIVTTGGRQTGKVLIEKDAFVIGRSQRCDLVLDDKNVSREHAVVVAQSGRYQIRDRGSRNSTLLNGVQLTAQAPLKEGDKIRIGPYELRFLESAGPAADGEQELSKTGFIPAGKPQQQNKRTDLKNKAAHVGLVYKLTALSGPQKGNSWSNWSGDVTFGRAADNTVVLQEDVVSLVHATISRTDGHFCIDDPGSSNGTFVHGGRVRSARLQHNQQIRIGSSTFLFAVTDPAKRNHVLTLAAISVVFIAVVVAVVLIMMPADQSEPLIQQGLQLGKDGNFVRAKELLEQALIIQPGSPKAARYLKDVDACIERNKTLQLAKTAAEKEDFDGALDICSKLLVKYPGYKKAKELEFVIGKVRDAQTALDSRNWDDASTLLAKAAVAYPDSTILARRLALAKAERVAQDNLARAKDLLSKSQSENAGVLLTAIPASSVYLPEARELLQNMKSADLLLATTADAQASYKRGDIVQAHEHIQKGLKLSPGSSSLIALEQRISQIDQVWKELQALKDLAASGDVSTIRRSLDACKRVALLEPDPQNYFRQQADKMKLQFDQALIETERNALARAEALARDGNKREAFKYYTLAASANPGNQGTRKTMDDIAAEITSECQKVFREGLVYEETGQPELAIAAYEKILKTAIDGDKYCERAREKLSQLKK